MPSTRRRFLAGVTALSAALAGCNEGSTRAVEETATPVAVPRTDREVLSELAAIETPDVRTAVLVSEPHLAAAVDHVERLRDAVAERRHVPEDADDERISTHRRPEEVLERAEDRLAEARETGPSEDALSTLRRAVRELARVDGLVRVVAGDVDVDSLRASIEAEREATAAVRDRVDYRVARPVADHLPTAAAAERTLESLEDVARAENLLEEAVNDARRHGDGRETDDEGGNAEADRDEEPTEPHPDLLASVHERLELHRRRREDAERYLETATDPDAPSLRSAITAELDALESDLAAIADRAPEESDGYGGDGSNADDIRSIRPSVAQRSAGFYDELSAHREDGRRLHALFRAARRVIEFRAIDVAVERTVPVVRQREFPADRLPEQKRRTVDALGRLADGSPLQRQFGETAADVVRSADRFSEQDNVDERGLAQCHLLLVAGAEWAERALERGEALSESLQAQQS